VKDSEISTSGRAEQSARHRQTGTDSAETARLTLRMSAKKARQLREVARQRGMSVNSLLDEMASLAIFEFELVSATRHT
jgi:predicted HicB family RNase H-like nuclease